MDRPKKHFYEFGPFRLDVTERMLTREGRQVQLTMKAFDTLLALVRNSGRVVEKDKLLSSVWPDTFVEEGVLSVNIFTLRKALAEGDASTNYIETVPRRGYRFVAGVKEILDSPVESSEDTTRRSLATRSIAILPFKSLSAHEGDEYLGFGIADALITKLGKIKSLAVRPTSSVRKYGQSEQDAAGIGRELMVAYVLEGSVRRSCERVRVTVQLVTVRDGAPIWADKFDEEFTDIFAVEDRVSEQVAEALMLQLSGEEKERLTRRDTDNSQAYQFYLKGRYFWNKRSEEGIEKGIEYFRQAIDIDPGYALAYAGLADSYLAGSIKQPPMEAMPKAKAAATKAIELDDHLGEAHTSLARINMSFDWDWAGAEREFKRGIELNPNYATAHQWYANCLLAVGRISEAIEEIRRAQELDPLSLVAGAAAGWVHFMSRRYDEALTEYKKVLEMDPNFAMALREIGLVYEQKGLHSEAIAAIRKAIAIAGENPIVLGLLAHVYAKSDRTAEAQKILERLMRLSKKGYVSPHLIATVYIGMDDKQKALDWLERACEDRSSPLVWLKVDPHFDSLRDDERFKVIMRRLGHSS